MAPFGRPAAVAAAPSNPRRNRAATPPVRARRSWSVLAAAGLAAGTLIAGMVPAQAAPPAHARPGVTAWLNARIRHMTLAEKVGQLFVTLRLRRAGRQHQPGHVRSNQEMPTASTSPPTPGGAEVPPRRHHLFLLDRAAWPTPHPDRDAVQRPATSGAATDTGIPLPDRTDEEGGAGRPGCRPAVRHTRRATWPSAPPVIRPTRAPPPGPSVPELAAIGINLDDAPVVDVNTNPANTADGARSFGDDPAAVAAYGSGGGARLP